mmetsp:Transcript_6645/g.15400  ORF Transcript_6645/g.15400 Transcript_6645/m.15400 type:complete len:224 (-) Transcript_6645:224-895(-)
MKGRPLSDFHSRHSTSWRPRPAAGRVAREAEGSERLFQRRRASLLPTPSDPAVTSLKQRACVPRRRARRASSTAAPRCLNLIVVPQLFSSFAAERCPKHLSISEKIRPAPPRLGAHGACAGAGRQHPLLAGRLAAGFLPVWNGGKSSSQHQVALPRSRWPQPRSFAVRAASHAGLHVRVRPLSWLGDGVGPQCHVFTAAQEVSGRLADRARGAARRLPQEPGR